MTLSTPVKVTGLLVAICVLFLAAIAAMNYWNSQRTALMLHDKEIEQTTFLNQIVELNGNSLKTVSVDFARWDEMAEFALHPDAPWALKNIDGSMPVYGIDAAWIFSRDQRMIYSYNRFQDPLLLRGLPEFSQVASLILTRPFLHYFVETPGGVLEIRSAPIRWQSDSVNDSPSPGYFFVAQLWDDDFVERLALVSGHSLTLTRAARGAPTTATGGSISLVKPLHGLNDKPVAYLSGSYTPLFLGSISDLSKREIVVFVGFALTVILLIALSLWSLVRKPLTQISTGLTTRNQFAFGGLENQKSEFGQIASMIVGLLTQKKQLEIEIRSLTQTQQQATEEATRLNQWLDGLNEVVWAADAQGRWVYFNNAASKFFGCEIRELIGRSYREKQLPREADRVARALVRVLRGESLSAFETEFLRKDGTRFAVSISATRILDADGSVIGVSGSARDDSRRKQMEAALADSEERFRTLVANIPGVVYRCDADESYTMRYLSPEIERLCGAPPEDFINNRVRSFADIIYPDDRKVVSDAINSAVERHDSFTIEYRILTADGSLKWVHEQGKPIYRTDGSIAWLDGVLLDITDRKEVQNMIRELEERNKQILDAISEHVVVSGPNGNIIWANRAVLEFHKLTPDRLPELERDLIGDGLSDVFRHGITEELPEETMTRHDGEKRVFQTVRSPILDVNGKPTMAVSVARDVTERAMIQDAQLLSERHFRTIVENSAELITVLDVEGRIRYQSPAVTAILGYGVHEQALENWSDNIHPEDLELSHQLFVGQNGASPIRCRFRHKGGFWVTLEMSGSTALDPQGTPMIIVNSHSVDDFVLLEESLRDSQAYLQNVFNAVQTGILVVNQDSKQIIDANLTALDLIGACKEEVLGTSSETYIQSAAKSLETATDLGLGCGSAATLLRSNGTRIPITLGTYVTELHGHSCTVVSFFSSEPMVAESSSGRVRAADSVS